MISRSFDTVIVGAGIVGAWCFYRLAGQGRVLLIDSEQAGLGITARSGGIVRACHDDAERIASAARGCAAYDKLRYDSRSNLDFFRSGYLHFGAHQRLDSIVQAVTQQGVKAEVLDQCDLIRFADLRVIAEAAVYEPYAGYFDSIAVVRALVSNGVMNGGKFVDSHAVTSIEERNGSVTAIGIDDMRIETQRVVLCVGADLPGMLSRLNWGNPGLWNQLIEVVRFTGPKRLPQVPSFYDDVLDINGRYCTSTGGLYIGHTTHIRTDPETRRPPMRAAHAEKVKELGEQRFGYARDAQPAGGLCHVDSYSASPLGLVVQPPDAPLGSYVVGGFSGGGYKLAPAASERLAALLQ